MGATQALRDRPTAAALARQLSHALRTIRLQLLLRREVIWTLVYLRIRNACRWVHSLFPVHPLLYPCAACAHVLVPGAAPAGLNGTPVIQYSMCKASG
jgi:hypothetical protein